MRQLKYLYFYILFCAVCNAQPPQDFNSLTDEYFGTQSLTPQQRQSLQEELFVQTKLIEGIQEIHIINGAYNNLSQSTEKFHSLLVEGVKLKTSNFPKNIQDELVRNLSENTNKNLIKKTLVKIQEFAHKTISTKYTSIMSSVRRYGIQIGIFYAITAQIDYTLPLVLASIGQPELGMALFATPISSSATASFVMGKNAMKYYSLVKKLGGLNIAVEHLNLSKKIKAHFGSHIFGKYDLIKLNISGINHVLTVQRPGILNKFINRLGLDDSINYQGLIKLMQENNFLSEFIDQLQRSDMSKEVKLYTLLAKIEQTDRPQIMQKMQEKYSKYIKKMHHIPNLSTQRQWIIQAASASNFQQLYSHLSRIPDGIAPRTLDKLWREYILVNACRKIDNYGSKVYYKAFRNLFKDYEEDLRVILMSDNNNSVSDDIRKKFKQYIFDALEPINRCELDYIRFPNHNDR